MPLNAAKCKGYHFYGFWVIMRKPIEGKITPTQIRIIKKKKKKREL